MQREGQAERLDLGADLVEVGELGVGLVGELGLVFAALGGWNETEDARAACDDAAATREEVATDESFENGRLAGGLAADDGE